jgi:hypothetical protein
MTSQWLGYPDFRKDLVVAMTSDMRRGGGSRADMRKSGGWLFFRATGEGKGAPGVANPAKRAKRAFRVTGAGNGRAVITEESVREIRTSSRTTRELADHHRVSLNQIRLIKARKRWAHVL